MIDPRIVEISRRSTIGHLEQRWDPFVRSIRDELGRFAVRGTAQSSMATQAVGRICAAEAGAAVQFAWQNLWRVAVAIGVQPGGDLPGQLKAEVRAQTEAHFQKLVETLEDNERRTATAVEQVHHDLAKARELALVQVDAEVDLAVASAEGKAQREGVSTVQQFYGPVGAVLSGPHASASVVQNIGSREKAELVTALDRLVEAIIRSDEVQRQDEVIEVVREARDELGRQKPNSLRLTSMLEGVGHAVQTIGSVQDAYQAVKIAAALIGVNLP